MASDIKPLGLATAIALAGGIGAGAADAEQPELFADADDAPMPLSAVPARKGAGRPAGARNRSTEERRQWFLRQFQSPVMVCGHMYSRPMVDICRELGLVRTLEFVPPGQEVLHTIPARMDAEGRMLQPPRFVLWDLPAAEAIQRQYVLSAMPYIDQKQPLAVEAKGNGRALMILGAVDAGDAFGAEDGMPIQQNQRVIDVTPGQSDGSKSETLQHQDVDDETV